MLPNEIEQRLKDTKFVVEATDYEKLCLWQEHSGESIFNIKNVGEYAWKQLNPGWSETIGYLSYDPICISMDWATINNVLIMFWDATSQVVDYKLIDKWFEKHCSPKWDNGTRLAHTNAMNFGHVLHMIERENNAHSR